MRITIPDLQPGTQYAIQVRATNGSDYSEWSRNFYVTTVSDARRPDAPQNVTWVSSGDAFVAEWDAVLTAEDGSTIKIDRYEMELVAGGVTRFVSITPQEAGGRVSYTLSFNDNTSLFTTPRGSIAMRVRAINVNRVSSVWTSAITATNALPAAPTNFVATGLIDSIQFAWTASTDDSPTGDVIGYNIYMGSTANFVPSSVNRVFSGPGNRAIIATTNYGLLYFKIRAVDKFNQESADTTTTGQAGSPFSVDASAPNTPTSLSAVITTDDSTPALRTSAVVSWTMTTPPTDLAGFVLRYRPVSTSNWNTQTVGSDDVTNTNSTIVTGLVAYTNYEFQIAAYDWSANYSPYSATYTASGATNAAPSTPAAPIVAGNTLQVQVVVPGTKAGGGAMESDVIEYEVEGATTSGFTSPTVLGKIQTGPAMVGTFTLPASANSGTDQSWYIRIRAVDRGGLRSPYSAGAQATVPLISTTNIADATITNAKIGSVAVDKLTAGTGLVNDFTIKAKLTLGDANNDGIIESYDYAGGTTGFRLAKSGLVIRTGQIQAPALLIQQGQNLMPAQYADFEYTPAFYTGSVRALTANSSAGTVSIVTDGGKFNNQYMRYVNTSAPVNPVAVYFAAGSTASTPANFNMSNLQPSTKYILSGYVRNSTSVATNFRWFFRAYNGTTNTDLAGTTTSAGVTSTAYVSVPATSGWQRIWYVFTTPADYVTGGIMTQTDTLSEAAGYDVDGIQLEEVIAGSTKPSGWAPPGNTKIDGNQIRTGSLISNTTTNVNGVEIPTWSIPLNGAASFANLQVRGNAVMGDPTDAAGTTLSSAVYIPGTTGWQLRSDGTADLIGIGANSITADSLAGGSLNNEVALIGRLVASGEMNESVAIGSEGLTVIGPREVRVISAALTSNVVTLTTEVAHNFEAGGRILVTGISDIIDGSYYIKELPSTTTLTYDRPNGSDISLPTVDGTVAGKDRSGVPGPTLISFPTDGAKSNIISANTTASSLTVTKGASLRGTSIIEVGSSLLISSQTTAPTAAPILKLTYNDTTISGVGTGWYINGATIGDNGNLFVLSSKYVSTTRVYSTQVTEHNPDTGAYVAQRMVMSQTALTSTDPYFRPLGITFQHTGTATDTFYVLGTGIFSPDTTAGQYIITYSTSWAELNRIKVDPTKDDTGSLGWDYIGNRLIYGKSATVSQQPVFQPRFLTINTDGTPVFTSLGSLTTGPNLSLNQKSRLAFIARGNFDLGSERFILKTDYNDFYTPSNSAWRSFNSVGTEQNGERWLVPKDSGYLHGAGFWRATPGKFYDVVNRNGYGTTGTVVSRTYQGGDMLLSGNDGKRTVAFAWMGSTGTLTPLSPTSTITIPRRGQIAVTIPPIPYAPGNANTPNRASIYFYRTSVTPVSWRAGGTISYPATSGLVNTSTAAVTPPTTNGFSAAGSVGVIRSTSGNSFWGGDDKAQFFELLLKGGSDVTTAISNRPPLRVRDILQENEMRVDGNEIQVMSTSVVNNEVATTAVGTLFLQQGGGAINMQGATAVRMGGKTLTAWDWGFANDRDPNSSGDIIVTHNLGAVPDTIQVTSGNEGNTRNYTVSGRNTANFTVRVRDHNNAVITTGPCDFFWFVTNGS